MPAYATSGTQTLTRNPVLPTVLYPGDEKYVWGTSPNNPGQISTPNDDNVVFETVAAASRSIAVTLAPRPGGGAPGLIIQISANGNPGDLIVLVQESAVDADGAYITPSPAVYTVSAWTQNGGVYTATVELQPDGAGFITLLCSANPGPVKLTAKIRYV